MLLAAGFNFQDLYKNVAVSLIKLCPREQYQALGTSANCTELSTC